MTKADGQRKRLIERRSTHESHRDAFEALNISEAFSLGLRDFEELTQSVNLQTDRSLVAHVDCREGKRYIWTTKMRFEKCKNKYYMHLGHCATVQKKKKAMKDFMV